jgi:acyl dehydratase
MTRYPHLDDLRSRVGQAIGSSDWVLIDQARINAFADATGDHQWIHIDPVRAAASTFGGTIAHGFLTLSLLPRFGAEAFAIDDVVMGINYGLDRVRFPSPVRVGSRLRGHFVLQAFQPLDGGAQLTAEVTVQIEGQPKPACVAISLSRRFTAAAPLKG